MYHYFKHPSQVCMSYFEHLKFSLYVAFIFANGSVKAMVHAFIPDVFITSTTDSVNEINMRLKKAGCRENKDD